MIRTILAWFGYAQIPLEVVQLSMKQEAFLSRLHDAFIGDGVYTRHICRPQVDDGGEVEPYRYGSMKAPIVNGL